MRISYQGSDIEHCNETICYICKQSSTRRNADVDAYGANVAIMAFIYLFFAAINYCAFP